MYNVYFENGVILSPNIIEKGDTATVIYKGLLHNSGADSVYMHMGSGRSWKNMQDIKMDRTAEGFEATLPITSSESLNVAFKDSASNWDNNSGQNYFFEIKA